jgi:hypothetical protein
MEPIEPKPLTDFRATLAAVREEEAQREEVMHSPDYLALEVEKKKIEAKQELMLVHVPDSREEHALDKAELMQWMRENERMQVGEFQAKTRTKRSVDTYRVLQALGGDIDALMLVASVTQTKLEAWIKDNPSDKRELRKCIIEDGYTIVDILPISSDE